MVERALPDDALSFIRDCVRGGRILWTYHVNMRLGQRFIGRETIIRAADTYEVVEAYPEDKYFPSYLLLGREGASAFHVVRCQRRGSEREDHHSILPQPR